MESDGPQSTDGSREAPPETNVVRLDEWIGPREELVPFGLRRPASEAAPTAFAATDPPPSAEDFWGERAAAIHDAVPGPAEAWASAATAVRPPKARARRRALLAGATGLAVAAVAGIALLLGLEGGASSGASAGATKTQLAFVLSDGMSRVLGLSLPAIQPRSGGDRRVPAQRSDRIVRHRSHPHPTSEPVRHATVARSDYVVSQRAPTSEYSARVAPATPAPSTTSEVTREPSTPSTSSESRSTASSAAVSPTGESGALGPVHSPNG